MGTLRKTQTAKELAEDGLSMFRMAINKLRKSTDVATIIVEGNNTVINDLITENEIMNKLVGDNNKVIDNISSIIDPK